MDNYEFQIMYYHKTIEVFKKALKFETPFLKYTHEQFNNLLYDFFILVF